MRSKRRATSTHGLSAHLIRTSANATCFAEIIGLPLNFCFVIRWRRVMPRAAHSTISKANTDFLNRLKEWFRRRELQTAYRYTVEKQKNVGLHIHYSIHVPAGLEDEVRANLLRWLAPGRELPPKTLGLEGWFKGRSVTQCARWGKGMYVMKGTLELPGTAERALVRALGIRTSYQGRIDARRGGTSQNIGPKRRKASGWIDFVKPTDLAALMALLHDNAINSEAVTQLREGHECSAAEAAANDHSTIIKDVTSTPRNSKARPRQAALR